MKRTAKAILTGVALLGAWIIIARPPPPADIHAEIQQRLLEAELGSATTFHFAAPSRDLTPDAKPAGALLRDLDATQPETRWQAAKQLAVRRDLRAVESVIRAMRDPDGTGRVCVMASVPGHLRDPRALGALTEAAFDPGNRDLRLCAIQSLGMIGDRRAVPALIEAVRTGNNPVYALAILGYIGGADEIILLRSLAAASREEVRLTVIRHSLDLIQRFSHRREGLVEFARL